MPKANCKGGDMVGECIMMGDATITPSLVPFVLAFLMILLYGSEQF